MENSIDTVIGLHVVLKGNIKNKGSIQVNGTIEGEVRSEENVFIGETAKVKGPVVAKTIEVSGEVNGLIEASAKLEIHPTGKVLGDLNAKSLIIHQGATFIGKSLMPSAGKAAAADDAKSTPEADTEKPEDEAAETETAKEEPESKKQEPDRDPLGFFRK